MNKYKHASKKTLLTIVLAIAMVLTIGALTTVFANDEDNAETITLNSPKTYTLTYTDEDNYDSEHYYKFVPAEKGYYQLFVAGELGDCTRCIIFDEDDEVYNVVWGDDEDDYWNNEMYEYAALKAGKTYYICIEDWDVEDGDRTSLALTTRIVKHTHTLRSVKRSEGTWYGCEDERGYSCSYEKFKISRKPVISKLIRGKKYFTVKWVRPSSRSTMFYASNYQIQYSTSKSFKKAKSITVSPWNSKGFSYYKKISKLKRHKKYYVRMRIYARGYTDFGRSTYYGPWSKIKAVKTK